MEKDDQTTKAESKPKDMHFALPNNAVQLV